MKLFVLCRDDIVSVIGTVLKRFKTCHTFPTMVGHSLSFIHIMLLISNVNVLIREVGNGWGVGGGNVEWRLHKNCYLFFLE